MQYSCFGVTCNGCPIWPDMGSCGHAHTSTCLYLNISLRLIVIEVVVGMLEVLGMFGLVGNEGGTKSPAA